MTEAEYIKTNYPDDFILVGSEYLPLPKGGKIDVEQKEISSTFTTADGTKRKDIIKKYEAVSIKYSTLLQKDFENILTIIKKIENADYNEKKNLFLKKEVMPLNVSKDVQPLFLKIKIDIVQPAKASFAFRKNGLFIYQSVNLKIN